MISNHVFRTKGKILIDKGWKEVLDSNTKETILNEINNDENALCESVETIQLNTSPKAKYTDSTLLRAMETLSLIHI